MCAWIAHETQWWTFAYSLGRTYPEQMNTTSGYLHQVTYDQNYQNKIKQELVRATVPSCTQASCTSLTAACSTMFLTKNRLMALSCNQNKPNVKYHLQYMATNIFKSQHCNIKQNSLHIIQYSNTTNPQYPNISQTVENKCKKTEDYKEARFGLSYFIDTRSLITSPILSS